MGELLKSRIQFLSNMQDIDEQIAEREADEEIEKHLATLRSPNSQQAYDEARRAIELLTKRKDEP
jgi:hypothetical protein